PPLVPGPSDATRQRWFPDSDGGPRYYRSSDAAGGPAWVGMDPADAIRAVTSSGLSFEGTRVSGVVLHMFPALTGNGTIGVTAIGRSAAEADELFGAVPAVLDARARTAG